MSTALHCLPGGQAYQAAASRHLPRPIGQPNGAMISAEIPADFSRCQPPTDRDRQRIPPAFRHLIRPRPVGRSALGRPAMIHRSARCSATRLVVDSTLCNPANMIKSQILVRRSAFGNVLTFFEGLPMTRQYSIPDMQRPTFFPLSPQPMSMSSSSTTAAILVIAQIVFASASLTEH